jgi:hypothetical protein
MGLELPSTSGYFCGISLRYCCFMVSGLSSVPLTSPKAVVRLYASPEYLVKTKLSVFYFPIFNKVVVVSNSNVSKIKAEYTFFFKPSFLIFKRMGLAGDNNGTINYHDCLLIL